MRMRWDVGCCQRVMAAHATRSRVVTGKVVRCKVEWRLPAAVERLVELLLEVQAGDVVRLVRLQCVPQVVNVLNAAELRNARVHHHHEQADQEVWVAPQDHECILAQLSEPATGMRPCDEVSTERQSDAIYWKLPGCVKHLNGVYSWNA